MSSERTCDFIVWLFGFAGSRKFGSLAKQLNAIDKLPKKSTMTLQQTKSLLDKDNTIPNTQFQALLQAKMEHMLAVSLPVS